MEEQGRVLVIGVGSEFRRDDGAGLQVVARLGQRVAPTVKLRFSDGDPAGIIEAWEGAELAIVVDTVLAEPARPGRLHRLVLHLGHPEYQPAGSEFARPGPG